MTGTGSYLFFLIIKPLPCFVFFSRHSYSPPCFFLKKKIITIIPHANCRNEQFDGSKPDLGILLFHEIQNLKFAGAVLGHRALFPTNL